MERTCPTTAVTTKPIQETASLGQGSWENDTQKSPGLRGWHIFIRSPRDLALSLSPAGPQLLRTREQPLREIGKSYTPFLGQVPPPRAHTLGIFRWTCPLDMKKKRLLQPHPWLPLLSHPHRELWTQADGQFYIHHGLFFFI